MSDPRVTDKVVGIAFAAFTSDKFAHPVQAMRAALEAAVPLLAPQPSKTVVEAVAYLRARGEDEAVGTIDTRWAYKRSADYIESTLAPPVVDREALARAAHHYFCVRRSEPNHDPRRSDYDKADEILEILALINGSATPDDEQPRMTAENYYCSPASIDGDDGP